MSADWPVLRHVEIRAGPRLGEDEVLALAALDDAPYLWAMCIPREALRTALETHPLIERAEVSLAGPRSLRIDITERRPLAAIEHEGYRIAFDRTGELLEILPPTKLCSYPIVKGVPLGLLQTGGVPLHQSGKAWPLPERSSLITGAGDWPDFLDLQFKRVIHLQNCLSRYAHEYRENLLAVRMDRQGRLEVEFSDCPTILLGIFDHPEAQFRRLLGVLGNPSMTDPEKVLEIDLSSMLFPVLRVKEECYSPIERMAGSLAETAIHAETINVGTWEELDDEMTETNDDMSIFSLAGEGSDDG